MTDNRVLTREEEISLFERYKTAGDREAFEEIIACNRGLVVNVAESFIKTGADMDDLISEGYVGLIKAVGRFDHTRGFKFSTYAIWWINQSIKKYLRDQSRTIRLPAHVQEKLSKINKFKQKFIEENGDEPSCREIAEAVGLTEKDTYLYISSSEQISSLNDTAGGENGTQIISLVPDEGPTPEEEVELIDRDIRLRRAVEEDLSDQERFVIQKRFGLGEARSYTLKEVGAMLGVCKERVRQIEIHALFKLRTRMEEGVAA